MTSGFVLDMDSPSLHQILGAARAEKVLNDEALAALRMFEAGGLRYAIVAGRLHKDEGIVAIGAVEASQLVPAFVAVNERLASAGALHTSWVIDVEPELRAALERAGAEYAGSVERVQ